MESVPPIVMNPTERIVSGLFAGGFAAAVATVALFDPDKSSIFPACPLLRLTGFACPGCGVTRGFHALFHGDFLGALDYNALIPIYSVGLVFLFVSLVLVAVRGRGLNIGKIPASVIYGTIIVAFLFAILRNLPFEPFRVLFP